MPELWLMPAAIAALVLLSALLTAAETALAAVSRSRLRALAEAGETRAARALALAEAGERLAGAVGLGQLLAVVTAVALATAWLSALCEGVGVALAIAGAVPVLLVFGQVLPRARAIAAPEPVALRAAPTLTVLLALLGPPVAASRAVLRLFGLRLDPDAQSQAMREEIAGAIAQGHSGGAVEKEDRDRLLATLDLSDRTVEEVMKHRSELETVNAGDAPERILTQVLGSPHTRLPVWRDDPENIVGVLHSKDLLREVDRLVRGEEPEGLVALDVLKVARKPYFVPETADLDDQMREFLKRRTHFALVVDEYGSLRGLITLEDIIEEIVGEITDEFDVTRGQGLRRTETGEVLVNGAMSIRDLNRALDWALPDGEANTIAGLVVHEAQTIPAEGQVFSFHGVRFEVAQRRENRLTRLKLRRLQSPRG